MKRVLAENEAGKEKWIAGAMILVLILAFSGFFYSVYLSKKIQILHNEVRLLSTMQKTLLKEVEELDKKAIDSEKMITLLETLRESLKKNKKGEEFRKGERK
jgi:hypothetical protein